jgi:putative DNA primase/helicase
MDALKEPNPAGYDGDPNDVLKDLGIDALRRLAEEARAAPPSDDPGNGEYDEAGKRFDETPPNEGEATDGQGWKESDKDVVAELPDGYRYNDGTIEYSVPTKDGLLWFLLCSAVEFLAVTRNPEGKGWGLALRIRTHDRKWNSLTVTQAMTVDTKGFFAALYDHGFNIPPAQRGRFLHLVSLAASSTTARVCCVPHVGWHELADGSAFFALPDQTFGAPEGEEIVYQPQWNERPLYRLKGTLKGWQDNVARYAVKNSRLAFALAAGFAGPLLYLTNEEGGGVHFHGRSSIGKTRLLKAKASIWTGGGINGGIGTWRGTDNGIEGKAWAHNDTSMDMGRKRAFPAASPAGYSLSPSW